MNLTMYLAFSDELSTLHCKLKNYLISTVYSYAHIWDVANDRVMDISQQKQFQSKLTWIIHSSILQFLRPIATGLPHFYFLIITNLLSHTNRTASFPTASNCKLLIEHTSLQANKLQTTDWAHFLARHQTVCKLLTEHTSLHAISPFTKYIQMHILCWDNKRASPTFFFHLRTKDYSFYRTKSSSQNNLDSNCSYCRTRLFKAMTLKSMKLHKTYHTNYILTTTMLKAKNTSDDCKRENDQKIIIPLYS